MESALMPNHDFAETTQAPKDFGFPSRSDYARFLECARAVWSSARAEPGFARAEPGFARAGPDIARASPGITRRDRPVERAKAEACHQALTNGA